MACSKKDEAVTKPWQISVLGTEKGSGEIGTPGTCLLEETGEGGVKNLCRPSVGDSQGKEGKKGNPVRARKNEAEMLGRN